MNQENISFAGAGRVATALGNALFHAGRNIDLIVSETGTSGKHLATACNSKWSTELTFPGSTKIIIVAVPDQKLEKVLPVIKCDQETLVVHTAGSFGLEVFPDHIKRKGVFYPLQTFSKNRIISFTGLPVLIESADANSERIMDDLAGSLSAKIYHFDSEQRKRIHLAAVFVCNFTNHMLTLGKEISDKSGFPFEILNPLIHETISKAIDCGPEISQTGPAMRNDLNTIKKHLDLLSFSPGIKSIYNELTRSIISYYDKK